MCHPCQPRVTVPSCFVYKVIRDLKSIDHLCNKKGEYRYPILFVQNWPTTGGNATFKRYSSPSEPQVIYRFAVAQVECKSYSLLNNCKQNITPLSLLDGTTVQGKHLYILFQKVISLLMWRGFVLYEGNH